MKKEELKNKLLSFNENDYYSSVDLHIHSNESDGEMTPVEIIINAQRKYLKLISVTDHNTIDGYLNTNILKDDILITGAEFDCLYKGVLIHILGYGFDIDNEELKSLYAKNKSGAKHNICRLFKLRNPKEVIEKINKAGGIAVLAHPCCYWAYDLNKMVKELVDMGLEGIEVYYPYNGLRRIVKFHSRKEVTEIADKYNLIKTGGTDTHGRKL